MLRRTTVTITLLVSLIMAINCPFGFAAGSFVSPPYLQALSGNSIYVLVESKVADPVTVEYGPTSALGSKVVTESTELTSPKTFVHNIKLTALVPEKLYYYRVSQGEVASNLASFRSTVNPGTPFRFAFMADSRTGMDIYDQITLRIKDAQPHFMLYGGDICDKPGYGLLKAEFLRPNQLSLSAGAPFYNSPGNHEGWTKDVKAFTQAPESASGTQSYYSFDYGDLHVLVLNYMDPGGYGKGSPQYNFAAADLAASKKKWKIVINHAPAYTAGSHGSNPQMIAMTNEIFEPNKVDMVLGGHSHFYQHNLVNGIHHMVIGSAGTGLDEPEIAKFVVKSAKDYSYAIVDVTSSKYLMQVYNEMGTVLDRIELSK